MEHTCELDMYPFEPELERCTKCTHLVSLHIENDAIGMVCSYITHVSEDNNTKEICGCTI